MALPALERYQFEFNGLLFGERTPFLIEDEIDGLFDTQMSVDDVALPRGDGAIPMPLWAEAPTIIFPIRVISRAHSQSIHDLVSLIDSAFSTRDLLWLRWRMAHTTWRRRGRVIRRYLEASPFAARTGAYRFVVAIRCPDPRYYADDPSSVGVGAYDPNPSGWDIAFNLPLDVVDMPGFGDGVAYVNGPQEVHPIVRVSVSSGDMTGFDLTNMTTGIALTIRNISADPGDVVTCDFDAYIRMSGTPVISIDGSANHAAWQQPRIPFTLVPGRNDLRFVPINAEALCRVDWYDTYI
jgi:hypothetical protein